VEALHEGYLEHALLPLIVEVLVLASAIFSRLATTHHSFKGYLGPLRPGQSPGRVPPI
jgi:hypothetical protein